MTGKPEAGWLKTKVYFSCTYSGRGPGEASTCSSPSEHRFSQVSEVGRRDTKQGSSPEMLLPKSDTHPHHAGSQSMNQTEHPVPAPGPVSRKSKSTKIGKGGGAEKETAKQQCGGEPWWPRPQKQVAIRDEEGPTGRCHLADTRPYIHPQRRRELKSRVPQTHPLSGPASPARDSSDSKELVTQSSWLLLHNRFEVDLAVNIKT